MFGVHGLCLYTGVAECDKNILKQSELILELARILTVHENRSLLNILPL